MSFERIVRPFQRTGFTPTPAPAIVEPDEPLENIRFEIGKKGGSAKMLVGSASGSITTFTKDDSKEISRETTERRVENPNDPSQYVNVQDTNKIGVESGKRDTYKQQDITFKPQE